MFRFDLTTLALDQLPKRFSASKPVVRHGQLGGICMYFKAIFDDDNSFSNGPQGTKTHWPMLLYRTPARMGRAGDIFEMQVEVPDLAEHLEWSWQIDIQKIAGLLDEADTVRHGQEAASI